MTVLAWDEVGTRKFENGLDRGVLYLEDGKGVAWSGLTEVTEKVGPSVEAVHFDGDKVSNIVTLSSFGAVLKAVTYPDEFTDLQGLEKIESGVYVSGQKVKTFSLSYRTMVGDDIQGDVDSYKLHIVYNVTAIASDTTWSTLNDSPELVEFEWDLTTIPSPVDGHRATSHVIIDSREVSPWLLSDIEDWLYGSPTKDAALLPIDDLMAYIHQTYQLAIVDHGDGTWSAVEHVDGVNIRFLEDGEFEIVDVHAIYHDPSTYTIYDTR